MSMPEEAAQSGTQDAIARRAAGFLQRRHFWDWSEADQAELDEWLAQSDFHRVAWLRLECGAQRLATAVAVHGPAPEAAEPARARRRIVLPLLAAASLVLFAAMGTALVEYLKQTPDRTYSTEIGGRTLLTFADRTQIELNTDTVVRFRMTGEERTVWLEKGEAWFHVSHDAGRPFSVFAGRHRITDLGTEFLVRQGSDRMEVALLAGRAALSAQGAPVTTLVPGDDAVATLASMSVTRKTPQELADELSWRHGLLEFRNTKLSDAVREFNRYNATKLVIADPAIADLKFTAEVRTDNFEGFLQLAQIALNLHADREGNVILISRETKKPGRHAP